MKNSSILGIFLITIFLIGHQLAPDIFKKQGQELQQILLQQTHLSTGESNIAGELLVHFIDVGQADCILIQNDGKNMLIDAGNNADSDFVMNYLKEQGVTNLEYVVGTHPHEDHIGSLDDVINNFNINEIMLPDITHTTKTFEDVLQAVQEKDKQITVPKVGSVYELGYASFTIVAPNRTYEEINDCSIVIRLIYGDTSFLFTGDAGVDSESDMCKNGLELSADVLKVGHHGSKTATSAQFLNEVKPSYAVISCGKDNDYGHPNQETLERLKNAEVTIYRTDEDGTILAKSDGKNISFVYEERK